MDDAEKRWSETSLGDRPDARSSNSIQDGRFEMEKVGREPIAIIGIGCRFPGA